LFFIKKLDFQNFTHLAGQFAFGKLLIITRKFLTGIRHKLSIPLFGKLLARNRTGRAAPKNKQINFSAGNTALLQHPQFLT
jgi:hypothetical protein